MGVCGVNAGVPVGLLEYFVRPRGFGGQSYYKFAWQYIAYAHLAFFSTPLIAYGTHLTGIDSTLGTLVWYVTSLSIAEITALASIGEVLIRMAIWNYSDNSVVEKKQIEWLEYGYVASMVATVVLVENFRDGAANYANQLLFESEQQDAIDAATPADSNTDQPITADPSVIDDVPVSTDDIPVSTDDLTDNIPGGFTL